MQRASDGINGLNIQEFQVELADRVIVVTGALGALGSVVTQCVQAAGALVAAVDKGMQQSAAPLPSDVKVYDGVDLTDAASARISFSRIAQDLGRIDGLVNIAGGFRWEKTSEGTSSTWSELYSMNLQTAVNATQASLPFLLKAATKHASGRIISLAAAGAIKAGVGMGPYAASKVGIEKLTEALAAELRDTGVTVNAIQPGIIDTPANRRDMADADFSRWVTPRHIADLIVFLLSSRASGIQGALIPVVHRL